MKKYKIELTKRQLNVYREALEFYSRFISGQVNYLPEILYWNFNIPYGDRVEASYNLKKVIFPELHKNASYGIGWSKDDKLEQERQISYEMYREVYVKQAKERKEKSEDVKWNVYDNDTLHYSDQPLPVVKDV
jgi:hypothetical protein